MGQSASALQLLRSGVPEDELFTRLQAANVNVAAKDEEDRTALHWSAASGYPKLAKELISRGVDVSARDINGDTALHTAAFKNHPEVLKTLIESNADLNLQDSSGMTALHWAVRENNGDCVDVLVAAGAELSLRNDRDQTPVDIAVALKRKQREDILGRLRKHAAYVEVAASAAKIKESPTFPQAKPKTAVKKPKANVKSKDTNSSVDANSTNVDGDGSLLHSQLMSLCSLWGLVKYSHPYVAYRAEINWDKALLEAAGSILSRSAESPVKDAEFATIISSMLSHLHDPNTRVVSPHESLHPVKSEASAAAPSQSFESPAAPRPQPYVELTNDKVAIVVLTDYDQFAPSDAADSKLDLMLNAFASAASAGVAVIFDVRYIPSTPEQPESVKGTQQLGYLFAEAFKSLLTDDLPLPTMRQRFFSGLPEQRRAFSSAFQHGFVVQDADILPRSSDQHISLAVPHHNHSGSAHAGHVGQKPLCFLVSRHTPQAILDIAIAVRSRGQAVFVYHADENDYKIKRTTNPQTPSSASSEYLVYEPYVSASIFHVPGTDGLKVFVRQNERVCPDGTVGFHPDSVVIPGARSSSLPQTSTPGSPGRPGAVAPPSGVSLASTASESDAAIRIGVEFCTGRRPVPRQRLVYPNFSVRRLEDDYRSAGSFPPTELRLLSLFRIWNAIQFFFPYKPLMDVHWDDVLYTSIPKFLNAKNALEYHIAVAELLKQLSDTHAFVRSSVLSSHVGVAVPAVKVTTLPSGETVVSHIAGSVKESTNIKLGDIVEAVDGTAIDDRRRALCDLFSASTPQALLWRSDMKLLAGEPGSVAKLSLKRKNGQALEDISVEISRTVQVALPTFNDSLKTYQILSSVDRSGNAIGWVDLTRLSFAEVDAAIHSVSSCTSIIFDVRGYTKGTIYRLGPMLATDSTSVAVCETPTMMPTLLSDDLQPPSLRSVQTCVSTSASLIPPTTRIVALVNEDTLSHGEFAASFLRAVRPDITLIGSTTNGAIGNITNLVLPGGIQVGFSGMGMTAADGSIIQRRGLVPDIFAIPSVDSLASGVDTVLDKAIEFLSS